MRTKVRIDNVKSRKYTKQKKGTKQKKQYPSREPSPFIACNLTMWLSDPLAFASPRRTDAGPRGQQVALHAQVTNVNWRANAKKVCDQRFIPASDR